MTKKICVIDGNSLMHRAYHAITFDMTSPDGKPTNAIFGFLNMFFKYIEELKPDVVLCAFDAGKATERMKLLESYKSSRKPMDEKLRCQFPIMEEILGSMAVPIIKVQGWEGDDVMGTLAKRSLEKGYVCYLVTGDKDMNQLVCDRVFTATTDRQSKNVIINDRKAVFEKFGVEPDQIIDYLALMGDSSDDIPGIPGIGEKSAREMLQKYGSIDGIYENLSDFKGKKLSNLIEYKEIGHLSQKLATINCNLDFECDISSIESLNYDDDILRATFDKYKLRSPLSRFYSVMSSFKKEDNSQAFDNNSKKCEFPNYLDEPRALKTVFDAIEQKEKVAFSFVRPTKAYERKFGSTNDVIGIATESFMTTINVQDASDVIVMALKSGDVVAYDVKEIIGIVYPHDTSREAKVSESDLMEANYFDLHCAANYCDSSTVFKKQEEFFSLFGNETYDAMDDIKKRAASFAYISLLKKIDFEEKIKLLSVGETNAFFDIDMKLVPALLIMERVGCKVDENVLGKLSDYCADHLASLTTQIYKIAGHEFSIDSNAQLSHVLFEELNLPPSKKTKTGFSTDVNVLKKLVASSPIAQYLISYRELTKLKSTYIDALPKIRSCDHLIHTTFNLAATATGRLSSSDPNLQNIPVRSEFGRRIREAFVPLDDESFFLSADYSQIELRLLAHLSGDENLIEAFLSGEDFHTQTASKIFKVEALNVTSQMRSKAKAVNFGIVYGQQAFSLSKDLGVSFSEAKDMIETYYESYPKVKEYLDNVVKNATQKGYAETIFGRRRTIPELSSTSKNTFEFGERTAKNHPMQGSAADIIKIAMIRLNKELLQNNLKSKIMIQVHDELDLSVKKDEIEDVTMLTKEIMENAIKLKVPLVVDVNVANNWADAH